MREAVSTGQWTARRSPKALDSKRCLLPGMPPVTTSIGTARAQPDESDKTLYERADNALLNVQETGRDRVMEGKDER